MTAVSINPAIVAARAHMLEALAVLVGPGQVVELRIPEAQVSPFGSYRCTVSGYFTDMQALADAALAYVDSAEGIYITLNPVKPDLLARASNRVIERAKHTTADEDIERRRWLFVDIDPVRPSGVCATEAERRLALEKQETIRAALRAEGWPEPVSCCSGSGAYLLYRVDLPAADAGLSARCLQALSARFSDDAVQVDPTTSNAARIARPPGTRNRKGDDSPATGRRHRFAEMDPVPTEAVEVLPTSLIEELIEEWAPPVIQGRPAGAPLVVLKPSNGTGSNGAHSGTGGAPFDLRAWLAKHAVPVGPPAPYGQGGTRWLFSSPCPWDAQHKGREVHVVQLASGGISAGCQHKSCPGSRHSGNRWHELRAMFEPGWQPRGAAEWTGPASSVAEPKAPLRFECNDIGNGKRLVHWHGENLRRSHEWKKWLVYDGARWRVDNTAEVYRMAKDARRLIYSEVQLVTGSDKEDEAVRQAIAKHAGQSASDRSIEAMVKLAASEMGVPILASELDADPWLLNCQNGTIDLRSGDLRPHRRADCCTKIAAASYNPIAKAPTWIAFLRRIMGWHTDEARAARLMEFLQRAAGYCLTGRFTEKALFIPWGSGDNGKSTFLNALRDLMGDYAKQAAPELLVAKKGETHPTEVADLAGARFVTSIETEEGQKLAESLVKWLSGGDKIKARRMREDFFEFDPTFKLWLATNHRPVIRGTDQAIWKRIKLIPFEECIPEAEQDKNLPDKLRDERAGILRWAVDGCLAWQKHGLGVPEEVLNATAGYQVEMDLLADFVRERILKISGAVTSGKELYQTYVFWCDESKCKPLGKQQFNRRIRERMQGVEFAKDAKTQMVWTGLSIIKPP